MKKHILLLTLAAVQLHGAASSEAPAKESLGAKLTRLAKALTQGDEDQRFAARAEIHNTTGLLGTIRSKAQELPKGGKAPQTLAPALTIIHNLPEVGEGALALQKESLSQKIARHASMVKHHLEGDLAQLENEIQANPGYHDILKKAAAGVDQQWKQFQSKAKEILDYLKTRPEFQ